MIRDYGDDGLHIEESWVISMNLLGSKIKIWISREEDSETHWHQLHGTRNRLGII